jgi:hypothetical protein
LEFPKTQTFAMTFQAADGAPAALTALLGEDAAELEMEISERMLNVIASQGIDVQLEPREFLRSVFAAHGRVITEEEIDLVLNQFTVMHYGPPEDDGGGAAPRSVARLGDGGRVCVVRRTNRNRKLENLNMTGGMVTAAEETKLFKDAAGLGPVGSAEKVNLEVGENLPALAFGSAHSVFYSSAEAGLESMRQHALMTAAMLLRLNENIEKGEKLLATQRAVMEAEAAATAMPAGPVPMTGSFRALMNQNKMLLETYAVGVSGWLSGIYLPKITACLMTAVTRPQSRVKAQSLLAKLDSIAAKLEEDEELSDDVLDELDATHAAVYAEIRRAGLTATLSKQMRGGFSASQKREDHQHSKFVTASLREELYYFIATAPMNVGRRVTLNQYPLPRMLVAAERFLDSDVCGTVDAFREGAGHMHALLPPDMTTGTAAFAPGDQFDTGGSIQNITGKTLRPEKTGSGVEEAEAVLRAPHKTQDHRHHELLMAAYEELDAAEGSKVKLNILDPSRSNVDRATLREQATQRGRVSTTEAADFVRQGNFMYLTERAPAGVPRGLLPKDARVSPHSGVYAPSVGTLLPSRPSWMRSPVTAEDMDNGVLALMHRGRMGGRMGGDAFEEEEEEELAASSASAAAAAARDSEEEGGGAAAASSSLRGDAARARAAAAAALDDEEEGGGAACAASSPSRHRVRVPARAAAADGEEEEPAVVNKKRSRRVQFEEEDEEEEEEEEEEDNDFVRRKKGKSKVKRPRAASNPRRQAAPPPSRAAAAPRRRMAATLGVRDEGDDDIPSARVPAAAGAGLPRRSQLSERSSRLLSMIRTRGGGMSMNVPSCPPGADDDEEHAPAATGVIPSLLSCGLPSIFTVGKDGEIAPSVIPSLRTFGGSAAAGGSSEAPDLASKLLNMAVLSNLQTFANKNPLNSALLSAFVDSFRAEGGDDDDGPALGDDFADI